MDETSFLENSYPSYRRRSPEQGGHTSTKMSHGNCILFDNRHVVPYNPYLTQKYNCHINIIRAK